MKAFGKHINRHLVRRHLILSACIVGIVLVITGLILGVGPLILLVGAFCVVMMASMLWMMVSMGRGAMHGRH
jgi:fatty-acid desaturase